MGHFRSHNAHEWGPFCCVFFHVIYLACVKFSSIMSNFCGRLHPKIYGGGGGGQTKLRGIYVFHVIYLASVKFYLIMSIFCGRLQPKNMGWGGGGGRSVKQN